MKESPNKHINNHQERYEAYFQKTGIQLTNTGEKPASPVFDVAKKIMNIYDKDEIVKHGHLLGEYRDIRTLLPNQTEFHIAEFVEYQTAVAHYELMIGELDAASNRLQSLKELGASNELSRSLAHEISLARIESFQKTLEEEQIVTKQIEGSPKVAHTPKTEPPKVPSNLHIFYTQSVEGIDFENVRYTYEEYKEALIPYLEAILMDSIHRYEYFKNADLPTENRSFVLHALYFLGALEAKESLPKVLDFLRMGEEFTQFWMGTDVDYLLYAPLYSIANNQLSALKAFAKEDDIYSWNKVLVSDVVSQIAHHQPERKAEVINWYKDVFTHFLRNPNNEKLIDTVFLTSAAKAVTRLRAVVLLPLIEAMYKRKWINPSIYGDLKKYKVAMQKPIAANALEPLPENLEEYYTEEYRNRKAEPSLGLEEMLHNQSLLDNPEAKAFMEMYTQEGEDGDSAIEEALLKKIKHLPPTSKED